MLTKQRMGVCRRLFMLGVFLAALFLGAIASTGVASAHKAMPAYSCSSPHCYAENDWYGPTGSHLGGGFTDEYVVNMQCGSGCSQPSLVSNELWVADATSIQHQYCLVGACWVEVGVAANYENAPNDCGVEYAWTQCYFWADQRPNSAYYFHPYTLPSDNYNQYTEFEIEQLSSSSWEVIAYPTGASDGGFTSYSTSNTMLPQNMQIGMELGGTFGVNVGQSDYYYTEWADSSVNWYYQTNAGCGSHTKCLNQQPPYGQWYQAPNCCDNGGDWYDWTS